MSNTGNKQRVDERVEQSRVELALQASEERYRSLFRGMAEGCALHEIICDDQGIPYDYRFLELNPAFERLTGMQRELVVGKTVREVIPDIEPDWIERYGKVALTGESMHFEQYAAPLQRYFDVFAYSPAKGEFAALFIDITERKRTEWERESTVQLLQLANESKTIEDLVQSVMVFLHEQSGCEAIGLRLQDGEDYPYYAVQGFPAEFVTTESSLCAHDCMGCTIRGCDGLPELECLCGNIIRGLFSPILPFISPGGSFWTNSTTELISTTSPADLPANFRGKCYHDGYESVALIPLCSGNTRLGLLQFDDHRPDMFSPEIIAHWERLAGYLAVALDKMTTEVTLQNTLQRFYHVLSSMYCGIIMVTADDTIEFANQALCDLLSLTDAPTDLFGLSASKMMEKMKFSFLYPDAALIRILEIVQNGEPVRGEAVAYQGGNISLRDYVPLSVNGKNYGRLWIHFDITDRIRAEESLQASLREKEVLLKEIHHRVKNNMQIISSLVSLQADTLDNPIQRALFNDLRDQVRSMALVHEKLYQSRDLAKVDLAEYTQSLLNYLWRAHGGKASSVLLTLDLQPVFLTVESAIPCGLILNELVTNVLKHAFRERTGGEIKVHLSTDVHGQVSLRVQDNGVGLPPLLDWQHAPSLGLQLVNLLSRQLEGTIEMQSSNQGTEFHLSFMPLEAATKEE